MVATRSRRGSDRRPRALLAAFRLTLPALVLHAALASAQTPPAQPAPAPTATADAPPPRFSGLLYGDYYDVLKSHRDELEGQNGFWIRRVYFAYDQALSGAFSMRLRLETNSRGDFKSTGALTFYMKDAWIKWTHGAHAVGFGVLPTPSIEFVDQLQGYRALEKSPIDLYRWDASRDLGLAAQGKLGAQQRTQYTVGFGNGSGSGSETDASKTVRGQLVHRFASGLVLEGYADWQDRPVGRDWSTLEALVAWQRPKWRGSLQYGHQRRRKAAADAADLGLDFLSAFAAARLRPGLSVVGRLDRVFQPVPGGDALDYFPFSEQARFFVGYAGVDVLLAKNVHLLPNVEVASYDRASDGTRPGSDVMPRATVFFSW